MKIEKVIDNRKWWKLTLEWFIPREIHPRPTQPQDGLYPGLFTGFRRLTSRMVHPPDDLPLEWFTPRMINLL